MAATCREKLDSKSAEFVVRGEQSTPCSATQLGVTWVGRPELRVARFTVKCAMESQWEQGLRTLLKLSQSVRPRFGSEMYSRSRPRRGALVVIGGSPFADAVHLPMALLCRSFATATPSPTPAEVEARSSARSDRDGEIPHSAPPPAAPQRRSPATGRDDETCRGGWRQERPGPGQGVGGKAVRSSAAQSAVNTAVASRGETIAVRVAKVNAPLVKTSAFLTLPRRLAGRSV